MLCPTVFNVGNRISNAPFSQSSWFLRPYLNHSVSVVSNKDDILKGAFVEFRHCNSLFSGSDRGAEIQCNNSVVSFSDMNREVNAENNKYNDIYMVD